MTSLKILGKIKVKSKSLTNAFEGNTSLVKVDLRNLDVSNVINIQYMFSDCKSLNNLNDTIFKN